MPDLDTMLQDFASFIEEELPPPAVETVLSAAATPPAMPRRWLRPVLVAAASAMLVLAVVGLPFLFLSGDESTISEPSTTTVAPTTTATPTTTVAATVQPTPTAPAEVVPFPASELAVLDVPLSEAVPGFSDTIVWTAVVESSDNVFEAVFRLRSSESIAELLWPPEDDPVLGDGLFFIGHLDASANWVVDDWVDGDAIVVATVPTAPGEPSQREIVGHDAGRSRMARHRAGTPGVAGVPQFLTRFS